MLLRRPWSSLVVPLGQLENLQNLLTDPTMLKSWPVTMVHLLPKTSLRLPAMEKDTEDAIDQPPTSQVILFSVSPSSVPTRTRIPVTRANPHDIGQI